MHFLLAGNCPENILEMPNQVISNNRFNCEQKIDILSPLASSWNHFRFIWHRFQIFLDTVFYSLIPCSKNLTKSSLFLYNTIVSFLLFLYPGKCYWVLTSYHALCPWTYLENRSHVKLYATTVFGEAASSTTKKKNV